MLRIDVRPSGQAKVGGVGGGGGGGGEAEILRHKTNSKEFTNFLKRPLLW